MLDLGFITFLVFMVNLMLQLVITDVSGIGKVVKLNNPTM